MKRPSKNSLWIEMLLLGLLGLSQIQCSQAESFISNGSTAVPQMGSDETSPTNPAAPGDWSEVKTLDYKGLFHAQVLLVLDNSESMKEEIADYINMRLQAFLVGMNSVNGLSYKLGITNTNFNTDQGRLLRSNAGDSILTNATPMQALTDIFKIFVASVNGSGTNTERGLAAAAAAVQRETTLFSAGPADAALSRRVVIISDANDTDNTPVDTYVPTFKSVPGLLLHPIIQKPDRMCSSPSGESYGSRYIQAVGLVGGSVNSICNPDFAGSLDSIFSWIQNVCINLDSAVQSRDQIELMINGNPVADFLLDVSGKSVCVPLPNQAASIRLEAHHQAP